MFHCIHRKIYDLEFEWDLEGRYTEYKNIRIYRTRTDSEYVPISFRYVCIGQLLAVQEKIISLLEPIPPKKEGRTYVWCKVGFQIFWS